MTSNSLMKLGAAAVLSLGLLAGCESPNRDLPAAKQALLRQSEQQLRLAQQNESPTNLAGQPPPELATPPDPEWQTGILEGYPAPFSGSVFRLENQWQRIVGANHVNVYAGAAGEDSLQGLAIVQATPVGQASLGAPTFLRTPTRSGALRIVAENGAILTLRATDGSTYTLDVATATLKAQ